MIPFFVLQSMIDNLLPEHMFAVLTLTVVALIFFYKFFLEFIMK